MYFSSNVSICSHQSVRLRSGIFIIIKTFKPFVVVALTQEDRSVLLKFYKVLVENIKSETMIGKLVQAGVLTHEEKNSINLAPRNPDRMKALLTLLPRKSTHALNAFCEAIKYRHTPLYDKLCKARQQALSKPGKYLSKC